VLPSGALAFVLLLASSDKTNCREMKAPFLLDTNYSPALNLEEIIFLRQGISEDRNA